MNQKSICKYRGLLLNIGPRPISMRVGNTLGLQLRNTISFKTGSNYDVIESTYKHLNSNIPSAEAGSDAQLNSSSVWHNSHKTARGYAVESLPFVETISPQLKRNIISDMDINLASLLVPYYAKFKINFTSEKNQNTKLDPALIETCLCQDSFKRSGCTKMSYVLLLFSYKRFDIDKI